MAIELKIMEMTLDGLHHTCPECGSIAFTLDARGPLDVLASVWGNCTNSHSWEEQFLTIEDLKQIQAVRTGRARPEDDDTFEIAIGGAVLAGILHPDLTPEDVKAVGRIYWKRLIKPALRRQRRKATSAMKRPVKNAVAATKAAAIGAAWGIQAGGHNPDPDYTPEPVTPCAACTGRGHHAIQSRIHGTTKVRCSVCSGTGEID